MSPSLILSLIIMILQRILMQHFIQMWFCHQNRYHGYTVDGSQFLWKLINTQLQNRSLNNGRKCSKVTLTFLGAPAVCGSGLDVVAVETGRCDVKVAVLRRSQLLFVFPLS